jgi:hypothetical protein
MSKKDSSDEFETNIEIEESSLTQKEKFPHEKYQTVRIRPEDFKKLKKYAFFKNMTMVDAISIALKSLKLDDE